MEKWIDKTQKELVENRTIYEKIFKQYYLIKNKITFEIKKAIVTKGGKIYFLDFFLPEHNLAIEIDGEYHNTKEQTAKDKQRDKNLLEMGIKTIRITNKQVLKGYNIIEAIHKKTKDNHKKKTDKQNT